MKKILFSMLALLLAMGGAWAQGPTQVTEITTDMLPASWATDDNDLTLADLQALGFGAVDASVAQAWTGAPQGEYSVLIYGFDGTYFNYIVFDDYGNVNPPEQGSISKGGFYSMIEHGEKFFYTGGAIELTKAGANQWTLGQAPDYDLELQVEYYEAHALKNIPAGWTVKINGHEQPLPYQGDSLMITETDSVTLVPAGNPRRVKSVTLADEAVLVNIDGVTLDITGCTYWSEIIARNSSVLEDYDDWVAAIGRGILVLGGGAIETSTPYDPAHQSDYRWVLQ